MDAISRRTLLKMTALAALSSGCQHTASRTRQDDGEPPSHLLEGLADFDGILYPLPSLTTPAFILEFWASWCAPCRESFPYLDQLFGTYQQLGLNVLGISLDEDPVHAQRFVHQMRPHFETAWDPSGEVADRFRVYELPCAVLLGKDAHVVFRTQGFSLRDHRTLEHHVQRMVKWKDPL